jgi:MFS family permease
MSVDKDTYREVDVGYDTLSEGGGRATGEKMSAFEIFKEEIVMLKWRVLVFACILTFGSYYIYDFPGAIGTGQTATIQSRFHAAGKNYNQEMNQALYSVYSWPNTVLAIFGGLLIDKFLGLRKAMALFVTLVFCGSVVFFFGVLTKQYALLIMGRVVFGLGGESLAVAQSAFVARWFKEGRGMALAFGISISFSRVGSSFNFLFSPMIASKAGIVTSVLFGTMACGVSVISCVVLILLDMLGTRRGLVPPESKETGEPFRLRQIKDMPILFWLASGLCVTVYCSVFPLIGIAKNFFQVKYGLSADAAAAYVSVYQFVCAGGSPVTGGMVDVIGRFSVWMIVAAAGFTINHLLFIVAKPPPPFMMAYMGIVYSVLVASLWPAIPYVVQPDLVGLAYGIMTAMQNTGLATWPLVSGAILDIYTPAADEQSTSCKAWNTRVVNQHNWSVPTDTGANNWTWEMLSTCCNKTPCPDPLPTLEGYRYTEIFFMGTAGAGLVVAIILFFVDRSLLGLLGASPTVREALKERLAEEEENLAAEPTDVN